MTRFLTRIDKFLPVQKGITDFRIKFNHEITPKIVQTKNNVQKNAVFTPKLISLLKRLLCEMMRDQLHVK